jgi:hypothetical protein
LHGTCCLDPCYLSSNLHPTASNAPSIFFYIQNASYSTHNRVNTGGENTGTCGSSGGALRPPATPWGREARKLRWWRVALPPMRWAPPLSIPPRPGPLQVALLCPAAMATTAKLWRLPLHPLQPLFNSHWRLSAPAAFGGGGMSRRLGADEAAGAARLQMKLTLYSACAYPGGAPTGLPSLFRIWRWRERQSSSSPESGRPDLLTQSRVVRGGRSGFG